MPFTLNIILPVKQDEETQSKAVQFKARFAELVQPLLETVLRNSETFHFARIALVEKTIQHADYLNLVEERFFARRARVEGTVQIGSVFPSRRIATQVLIIAEYDTSLSNYGSFFLQELRELLSAIFELTEDAPNIDDPDAVQKYLHDHNVPSLGDSRNGQGYVFSAYPDKSVRQILQAVAQQEKDNSPAPETRQIGKTWIP